MASLTSLTTSKDNCPPVIPSQKNTSSGYSHHPTGENQAEEENVKSGSNSGNPWGKGSYSDLITMALMSSPERKMTLDEIYRWISVNIPYFRNKGDEISSSGWKVLEACCRAAFISVLTSRSIQETQIFGRSFFYVLFFISLDFRLLGNLAPTKVMLLPWCQPCNLISFSTRFSDVWYEHFCKKTSSN